MAGTATAQTQHICTSAGHSVSLESTWQPYACSREQHSTGRCSSCCHCGCLAGATNWCVCSAQQAEAQTGCIAPRYHAARLLHWRRHRRSVGHLSLGCFRYLETYRQGTQPHFSNSSDGA